MRGRLQPPGAAAGAGQGKDGGTGGPTATTTITATPLVIAEPVDLQRVTTAHAAVDTRGPLKLDVVPVAAVTVVTESAEATAADGTFTTIATTTLVTAAHVAGGSGGLLDLREIPVAVVTVGRGQQLPLQL